MYTIPIQYSFRLPSAKEEIFNFQFDDSSMELVGMDSPEPPFWAALDFHQCPNCTLDAEHHPYCPLMTKLVDVVQRFDGILSYDKVYLEVTSEDRRISQFTTAQKALSSMLGLVMAGSGCPRTSFFKVMARFHLPLATAVETMCRASSFYLLSQYFMMQQGKEPDISLEGLDSIYGEIHIVNQHIAERIRQASHTDSAVNALIKLDLFASDISMGIDDSLADIRYLFQPYLNSER